MEFIENKKVRKIYEKYKYVSYEGYSFTLGDSNSMKKAFDEIVNNVNNITRKDKIDSIVRARIFFYIFHTNIDFIVMLYLSPEKLESMGFKLS